MMRFRVLTAALVGIVVLAATGCGDSNESATTAADTSTTTETTAGGCKAVSAPPARAEGSESEPTERLDPEQTYMLVFDTNCGSFTVTLDLESAPATSASLVALARSGFFDETIFHRIVPGFVIQGGDPTQTGGGGPGYSTIDAPPSDARYTSGTVAMAKTGAEPAGAAGSQFFVVTAADAGLPADYAIVGRVTKGLQVVERIGALGDVNEKPTEPVVIDTVRVIEQG